jgi:hypothetical protein
MDSFQGQQSFEVALDRTNPGREEEKNITAPRLRLFPKGARFISQPEEGLGNIDDPTPGGGDKIA